MAAGLIYLHSGAFRRLVEARATAWLAAATGRETSMRLVSLSPLTLAAEVADLRIAGRENERVFVQLDRGRIDLRPWPLLRNRVRIQDLQLDGLELDVAELPGRPDEPAPTETTDPPSLAELLDRVSIDRGRLTGGRLRAGAEEWPVELDLAGIAWNVELAGDEPRYRMDVAVREGSARLAEREWFAVMAELQAELDPTGVRVDTLRLDGPGVELHGHATLEDPATLSGSAEADASIDLGELPWPDDLDPEALPSGRVVAEANGRFAADRLDFEAHLTADRLSAYGIDAGQTDVRITGTDGGWTSVVATRVAGARIEGTFDGRLTPGLVPIEGRARWSLPDIATLRSLLNDGVEMPLAGQANGELSLSVQALTPDAVTGSFTINATNLRTARETGWSVAGRADGTVADGTLRLTGLRAQGAGLTLTGAGRADLDHDTRLDLQVTQSADDGAALDGALRVLEGLGVQRALPPGAAGLAGQLELEARLRGPGLRHLSAQQVEGDLHLIARGLTAAGEAGLPLDVDAALALAGGGVTLRTVELNGEGIRLVLSGTVEPRRVDAELELQAAPGTASRLLAEWNALGLPSSLPAFVPERIGEVRLQSRLTGPWSALDGNAQLSGRVEGVGEAAPARDLIVDATLDAGALSAELRLGGDGSTFDAAIESELGRSWPWSGRVRFDVVETAPQFWMPPDVAVSLDGSLAAQGEVDLGSLRATADLGVRDGALNGRSFSLSDTRVTLDPDRIEIARARVDIPGGAVAIDGSFGTDAAGAALRIHARGLSLADLAQALGAPAEVGGTLDLEASFDGSLAAPRLVANVETHGLTLEGQPLTDLRGPVGFGDGVIEADLADAGATARVGGSFTLSTQGWSADFDYPLRIDPSPWTGADGDESTIFEGRVQGALRGADVALSSVQGRVTLHDGRLDMAGEVFAARGVPTVEVLDGRVTVAPFAVEARGNSLKLAGELTLETGALSATIDGAIPLRPLSAQLPGSRLDGTAALDLRIEGTVTRPAWRGTLRVHRGRFDLPALPAPLERVVGTATLGPDRWTLDNAEFLMGGGPVKASGTYQPAGEGRRGSLELRFEGTDVRIPSIEGLRVQLDADLRLTGAPAGILTVAGAMNFDRAVYATDIDLQRELLGKSRLVDSVEEIGGVLDRVRLDVEVDAPGTLFVRNNLASIQTTANLRIGGTAADPLVTGRAELHEGGKVNFRAVTYRVVRGTLGYTADPPENPRLDIEGQTSVGTYDITLLVSGRVEEPRIELTSSPPLAEADIVSLLVTGRTRDALASSGAGVSETQAALYLGSGITRDVERSLARSLGLDQVTLDPVLVASEDDPAARLTLGKALTGRVFASYSRELGQTEGDIYQLRYTPFERLTFLAQHDDGDEFLGDALYERRFYQGPPRGGPVHSRSDSARVEGITIQGNQAVETRRLAKALGFHVRDRFRRTALLDGQEEIRELYLDRGYPEAEVETEVDTSGSGVAVAVKIHEGRRVDVLVEGPYAGELRRELRLLWQQSIFRDDIATDARQHAEALLAGHGYINAAVETRLESTGSDIVRLHVIVEAGPRVKIEQLAIEGNQAIDESTIRQQFLSLNDSPFKRDWLRPKLLAEDRNAVRSLYLGRGYLEVRVGEPEITYPKNPEAARVVLRIDEGPQYVIGAISFAGNEAYDEARLRDVAGLVPGRPYLDAEIRTARNNLRAFYDEHGYAGTRIDVNRVADEAASRADLAFAIDEAPRAVIESISIDNPGLTRTRLITAELELEEGEPLSADKLARSRHALYRTGLFRSVSLVEMPGDTPEGRRIELSLEERANIRTQLGLGYGSEHGVRASASVSHANLFGERLYGAVGARASDDEWRVYTLLREPKLWDTGLQTFGTLSIEQEQRDAFDIRRKSASVQLEPEAYDEARRSRWYVGYRLQEADVFRDGVEIDPGSGEIPDLGELIDLRSDSPVLLADLNVGINLGKRDDFAWPTKGNVLHASLSAFDSFVGSEAEFLRGSVQWSLHRRVGSGRVWSLGVRLGAAEPHGGDDAIPLSERFFVGGDTTVRGFRRDSIVPVGFPLQEFLDAGVDVTDSLGGEALMVINQEFLLPFFDPVALVAFYDAGNVYWERGDWDPTDLRHSAGLGIRVRTPVGPIRLEYGWKLDRQPDEDRGRFHFSIGTPF